MVKLNTVSNIDHMIKYKYFFILYLLIFFLNHCSLDRKTGIWTGHEKELERIAEMEKANQAQSQKIFSTKSSFDKEIASKPDFSNSLLTFGPTFSTRLKFTTDPKSEVN